MLGAKDPVMFRWCPALVRQMGEAYPELGRAQPLIEETLKLEETRFKQTLDRGLRLLDDELGKLPEGANLPGEAAFKLYDTYGFPLDLTQDALREQGRAVDTAGFRRRHGRTKGQGARRMGRFGRNQGRRDLVRSGRKARRDRIPGL
jgi:alanyl-tRNA synthetase